MLKSKLKAFSNSKICKKCKGLCCQRHPGSCMPEDFDNDWKKVLKALKSKKYVIEESLGDRFYFIRPRGTSSREKNSLIGSMSVTGPCIFWTKTKGCKLSVKKRPSGCRALEPRKNGCISHGCEKEHSAKAFKKLFKKEIIQLIKDVSMPS